MRRPCSAYCAGPLATSAGAAAAGPAGRGRGRGAPTACLHTGARLRARGSCTWRGGPGGDTVTTGPARVHLAFEPTQRPDPGSTGSTGRLPHNHAGGTAVARTRARRRPRPPPRKRGRGRTPCTRWSPGGGAPADARTTPRRVAANRDGAGGSGRLSRFCEKPPNAPPPTTIRASGAVYGMVGPGRRLIVLEANPGEIDKSTRTAAGSGGSGISATRPTSPRTPWPPGGHCSRQTRPPSHPGGDGHLPGDPARPTPGVVAPA